MKQMERSKLITYRWWRSGEKDIEPEHVEALEERAQERIGEMMKDGYSSGELLCNLPMTDSDSEDGVEYSGWWDVTIPAISED